MLVICEDCAKKYNIDESRIKGRRARFTCNECGHIIIVDKTDLTRSLLTGRSTGSPPPTLDLLREMEVPLATGNEARPPASIEQEDASAAQGEMVKRKNRGISVFVIFITSMIFLLICGSLLYGYFFAGYLQTQHLGQELNQQADQRTQIMLESAVIFGTAWTLMLVLFCVFARSLHTKFKRLINIANQISIGDYNVTIDTKGPQEIRDLAFALTRIKDSLKTREYR